MSFSAIGRLLGVSDVAVLKWVRAEAAALPEPEVPATMVTVEVDEMWRFLKKGEFWSVFSLTEHSRSAGRS